MTGPRYAFGLSFSEMKLPLTVFFAAALLASCTPDEQPSYPTPPPRAFTRSGHLILIKAKGASYTMGLPKAAAAAARPHKVDFTYDFWMDTTEVEQEDFFRKLGLPPSKNAAPHVPAIGVNFFFAVRYCNARSKAEGFDTMYTYTGTTSHEPHVKACPEPCYGLADVKTNFSGNGYRLPTEAEWEFAARAGTVAAFYWGYDSTLFNKYAWAREAASGLPHEVAQKAPNDNGLYDMAGNMMEWTNDFYSEPDSAETDPVGPDTGSMRIQKGGDYSSPLSLLRISERVPAYSADAWNGLGFRCVRRKIDQ